MDGMDRNLIWDIQEFQKRLRKNMKNLRTVGVTADIRNGYLLRATEVLLLTTNCSLAEMVTRYACYWKTPSSSLDWEPQIAVVKLHLSMAVVSLGQE
jgi:hypothetical protein